MKHQYGTKSTFVRSLDTRLPAREVVRLAKKRGIKLSIAQVYNIRATSRRRGITPASIAAFEATAHPVRDPNAADTKLRQLIGELGLIRSREIVAEMERRVA